MAYITVFLPEKLRAVSVTVTDIKGHGEKVALSIDCDRELTCFHLASVQDALDLHRRIGDAIQALLDSSYRPSPRELLVGCYDVAPVPTAVVGPAPEPPVVYRPQ